MCEEYDGATGFSEVIDLTPQQAQLLRETGITRGIDVSRTTPAKDVRSQCRFIKREALDREARILSVTEPRSAVAAKLNPSPLATCAPQLAHRYPPGAKQVASDCNPPRRARA